MVWTSTGRAKGKTIMAYLGSRKSPSPGHPFASKQIVFGMQRPPSLTPNSTEPNLAADAAPNPQSEPSTPSNLNEGIRYYVVTGWTAEDTFARRYFKTTEGDPLQVARRAVEKYNLMLETVEFLGFIAPRVATIEVL